MTSPRFNIPEEVWERATEEIRDLLVGVARRQTTVTYGEVVTGVNALDLEPDSTAFHHMLRDVSSRTFDEGAPLLTAVVVDKHDGKPGGGFSRLARDLGFDVAEDRLAEDVFWAQQLEAVHAHWRTRRAR